MANSVKKKFLEDIKNRYGTITKLPKSYSLFDIGSGMSRIYVRYSKIHEKKSSFYGLRQQDLEQLQGKNAVICFLWDAETEPLFVPFSNFEDVFSSVEPASDGQYKVQIFHQLDAVELYIANAGRFNVESFLGWSSLHDLIDTSRIRQVPDLTHCQIQTLLGSIGYSKGHDIWIPPADRTRLDWNLANQFSFRNKLPMRYARVMDVINAIDVVWIHTGTGGLRAMFEVEHSTPIYSGLLRFNDFYLVERNSRSQFSIVSNDERRSLFTKQVNRPTFQTSGLSEICNFLEYKDVFAWHRRIFRAQDERGVKE